MLTVQVLGSGCENCARVEQVANQVIAALAADANVIHVADRATWKKYGLLATPGLVVGDRLVCAGRIPTPAEMTTWIIHALEQPR